MHRILKKALSFLTAAVIASTTLAFNAAPASAASTPSAVQAVATEKNLLLAWARAHFLYPMLSKRRNMSNIGKKI